ncbi:MAG TPA: alpha/beta hydrolase [Acidimicrobiales bacterium]|jgi:pimeloyl-ACP methyl ester carboxylesterase
MSTVGVGIDDEDGAAPRHDIPTGGRSGFAMVAGRQVHYLEWGHRRLPPVLALHGGGQTAYMFEELGAAVGDRYHLLAPDLPGHGDSDPLPPDTPFGREAFATAVAPILDVFGLDRCPIVGASLGGITAITYAAHHPERVSGIVLIDVGHRLEPKGVRRIMEFMSAQESFASLDEAAAHIRRYLPLRKNVRAESLSRNLRQRADGRWVWKHRMGQRWQQLEAVDELDVRMDAVVDGLDTDAAGLSCPVLVLRGAASDVLSGQGAQEIVDLIPHARLEVVERAGHLAAGDNPQSTVTLIAAFLDDLP